MGKTETKFYAFTPAGTICVETEADTREACIVKLLSETIHMPYRNWQEMEERGYTVEAIKFE